MTGLASFSSLPPAAGTPRWLDASGGRGQGCPLTLSMQVCPLGHRAGWRVNGGVCVLGWWL